MTAIGIFLFLMGLVLVRSFEFSENRILKVGSQLMLFTGYVLITLGISYWAWINLP